MRLAEVLPQDKAYNVQKLQLEFLPRKPGEYEFACQMGMFRAKVIVE